MKNLIKNSILIVAFFTTIVMSALNDESGFNFKVVDAKMVSLTLENNDGSSKVSIVDSFGEVLYKESFKGTYFSKKYDLLTLPVGDYYFEVEGQTKIKLMPFTVTEKEVAFNNEVETIYYKPTVREQGDKIHISKIALNNEALTVVLYNNVNEALYLEKLDGDLNLEKTLNISKLKKGNYKLVLVEAGKTFSYNIQK